MRPSVTLSAFVCPLLLALLPFRPAFSQELGEVGDLCVVEDDCGSGLACVEGECDDTCSEAGSPCPDGYLCDGGHCVACVGDSDCLGRATELLECPQCHYCRYGECELGCDAALNPCEAGRVCADRLCVECAADTDCSNGEVCSSNRCVACRDDEQCGQGEHCVLSSCRACRGDEDCASGLLCMGGDCIDCAAACASGTCDPASCQPIDCSDRQFETLYQDFDESVIRADQEPRALHNAWCMRQFPTEHVLIAGHTDERNSESYNMALGERYVRSLRMFLIREGINADRIETISYGESRPVCPEPTESCWRQNRRIEMSWQ